MKVKAFLDTNVLIDVLTGVRASSEASSLIFEAVKRGYIEAVLSTQSIIDASYAIRKEQYEEAFFKTVIWACDHINIASIDTFNLLAAVKSRSGDFEDDAQYDCALANYCDFFVTSDKKLLARHGNSHPKLTLCTPAEFFERLKSEA